jgi:hypothetical protein
MKSVRLKRPLILTKSVTAILIDPYELKEFEIAKSGIAEKLFAI